MNKEENMPTEEDIINSLADQEVSVPNDDELEAEAWKNEGLLHTEDASDDRVTNSKKDNQDDSEYDEELEELNQELSRGNAIKKEIFSWIKVIVVAFVLAFVLGEFVFMNAYIPSGSMISTLNVEDKVIGFRLAYLFSEPERYDIVMFKYPDNEDQDFIKRIIGLPGETVRIDDKGNVYINDSKVPLKEPYLHETPNGGGAGIYEVPEDCYFMLGDNRNSSKDSRYWDNQFVHKDKILAKALFRYWPLSEFKWIDGDIEWD